MGKDDEFPQVRRFLGTIKPEQLNSGFINFLGMLDQWVVDTYYEWDPKTDSLSPKADPIVIDVVDAIIVEIVEIAAVAFRVERGHLPNYQRRVH